MATNCYSASSIPRICRRFHSPNSTNRTDISYPLTTISFSSSNFYESSTSNKIQLRTHDKFEKFQSEEDEETSQVAIVEEIQQVDIEEEADSQIEDEAGGYITTARSRGGVPPYTGVGAAAKAATTANFHSHTGFKVSGMRPVAISKGSFITDGVLTAGLISFIKGNSELGQTLMKANVVIQGATVALMVGSAYYYGESLTKLEYQVLQ